MELHTKDLSLRTVEQADIDEVARMWNFENGSISREKAQKAIEQMRDNHNKNRAGRIYHICLAVFEKGKDVIIGWCGLDGKNGDKLHLFYLIDAQYRLRGYATQCSQALLSYAFNEVNVPFINDGCDKNNIASIKVMEKIGMSHSGFEDNGDPLFYIDNAAYKAK